MRKFNEIHSLLMNKVVFFFDIVSPYSWIAWEVLLRYEKQWNLFITVQPVFLGGVMHLAGNRPPAELPARGKYLRQDLQRSSQYYGMSLVFPSHFPLKTLKCMRLLVAIQKDVPELMRDAMSEFWKLYWSLGEDVTDEKVQMEVLQRIGCDSETSQKLIKKASSPIAKETLSRTTKEAVDQGAFGLPVMLVTNASKGKTEFFFGSDRFHHIAVFLGKSYEGPLTSSNGKL